MIELLQGDCLAYMRACAANPAHVPFDVTVTSPPYNLGIDYKSDLVDDSIPRADYLAWTKEWLAALLKITNPKGGSLFLNIWGKPSNPWGPFEVALVARTAGWKLQNTIFWVKSMTDGDEESIGQFKPLSSGRFVTDCAELLLHLTPDGNTPIDKLAVGVPFADKSNIRRFGKNDPARADRRCRGNVWVICYPTKQVSGIHSATFPVGLPEKCFKLHGLGRIKRTFDPFSGTGTTAMAAKSLGLDHVGIEMIPENHKFAKERLC